VEYFFSPHLLRRKATAGKNVGSEGGFGDIVAPKIADPMPGG